MLNITTIILTYNEERHIARCIENVLSFSTKVYVIDSPSTDKTQDICKQYSNVEVVVHQYPGNQAEQMNWALDNLPIETEWILRLDADEYLSKELIQEFLEKIPNLPKEITGCTMKRDVFFMGKRIKYGKLKTTKLLRLWRRGKGRVENRIMDEHTILLEGESILLDNYFYDDNINGIDAWIKKHLDYANREASLSMVSNDECDNEQLRNRSSQKSIYYSLPPFHRAFWFFILRYFFLGGFLDGRAGFVWCYLQCWWYRTLVDIKLEEIANQK